MRESGLEGFDEFFETENQSIIRATYLVTGDWSVAAEVTQDAFTQAVVHWKKVQTYDKPGAWVRRVAIRQAVKVRQRDQRRRRLMIQVASAKQPPPELGIGSKLASALDVLSPKQRAAVVLHYFEDLPVHEVAEHLGCGAATASVHLHRARTSLAEQLGMSIEASKVSLDV